MKHLKPSCVLLALLMFALALSGANTVSAQSAKGAAPVVVTNTPLPVSGTVAVTALTPLPVSGTVEISGSVNLATGSSITINNPAGEPVLVRVVDESAKEPFQKTTFGMPTGASSQSLNVWQVPTGKRLVIEFVSFYIAPMTSSTLGGEVTMAVLSVTAGGSALIPCGPARQGYTTCSTPIKYYAEPDSIVKIVAYTTGDQAAIYAFISGYYVPVQ